MSAPKSTLMSSLSPVPLFALTARFKSVLWPVFCPVCWPLPRAAFCGAALGVILLAGCGQEQAGAPAQRLAPEVAVVTLEAGPITLTRELPGRVHASLVAEVRPQVDGIVRDQLFTEGGEVRQGQPLYQLDDAIYQAELNSAQAGLARARTLLENAQNTARRAAEMVKINAVSQQVNDDAQAVLLQAQADFKVAEAAVVSARVVVDYSRVVAPISGNVGKSSVTRGALVTSNQTAALVTVQQLDPLYVELTQSSGDWLALRKAIAAGSLVQGEELPVGILLGDGSRYPHEGRIAFAEPSVDPGTDSFTLRVVVPNPDRLLMPGMFVRAVIGRGVRPAALLVPQQGIARDPMGNARAMVVGEDGKVEARTVVVSETVGDQWLVETGLVAGERVVVEGLQKIRPGAMVRTVPAALNTPAAHSGGAN
ncbi:MAG: efflux RND transporter periplasmic adaptor subunit [Gammaproteobacteria bacterium]|nr:efflux RND transporter periplasmic adaptor subunit [Gammaproteobacteria bacterium]